MIRRLLLFAALVINIGVANAQRFTDNLSRGLTVTAVWWSNVNNNYVSWRRLAEEYYDTKYNLYANGVLIAQNLDVCNYQHEASGVDANTQYQVSAVVRGVEGEKCAAVKRWEGADFYRLYDLRRWTGWFDVEGSDVVNREGTDVTYSDTNRTTLNYNFNDVSLADVDGDGMAELIAKRNSGNWELGYNVIECYKIDGTRLWWIDLGPNFGASPDEQWDAVAYDWDEDGKAEVLMRGVDNMIIHKANGDTVHIGVMDVTYPMGLQGFVGEGNEYLLYLNGETAEPYQIMDYPIVRGDANDWGDGYGHRANKHYFGAPFLDGRHPFIFLGRGCYTQHKMKAFSVNKLTHELTEYWSWECTDESSPYYGQGYHNFAIADVDMDGRDEIVFGSMVIDDCGLGLSTTGLQHGDAQHCSDLDPFRWGLEQFACNEDKPCNNFRNATTSKIYYRVKGDGDDGRALAGNFSNLYPGSQGATGGSGGVVSLVTDRNLPNAGGFDLNSRLYWDGDLCEEILNSPGTNKGPKVDKVDVGRIFLGAGNMNNSSKNNPGAVGDIFGDWREEIVVSNGKSLRIHMSNWPSDYGFCSLWFDHQYRNAMVWQCMGYNQPPHPSFFIGELEGITRIAPPLTNRGRIEIANGGTISSSHNDKHIMVCETNDTHVSVGENSSPWVATFNVPSWVKGTNSTATDGNPALDATFYNCEVSGNGFVGGTRVVKQGEGILTLPNVTETYTGNTDIWGGVLKFDGTLSASNVWMNRFTKLVSDNGSFKNIEMTYGSELIIGSTTTQTIDFTRALSPLVLHGTSAVSTLSADTLKMGYGSRLNIDIIGNECDKLVAKALVLETKDWDEGPEYQTPVVSLSVNGGEFQAGDYVIADVDTIIGCVDSIFIEGVPNNLKTSLKREGKKLVLAIENMRSATDVAWTAATDGVWDFAKTPNFKLQSNGEATVFAAGDNVVFGDEAQGFDVRIDGRLYAKTITVNNSHNGYTFVGKGAITDSTRLIKMGSDTLTIHDMYNSYTGGTLISGGAVKVSMLSNVNKAKACLGAVNTDSSLFVMENEAALRNTANVMQGSPMLMRGKGGVIIADHDFVTDAPISGTRLIKRGEGLLRFNVANENLDTLILEQGSLRATAGNQPAKVVKFMGGVCNDAGNPFFKIAIPQDKSAQLYLAERTNYRNVVEGAGTLTIYNAPGVTRTPIAMDMSAFRGTIVTDGNNTDIFTLGWGQGPENGTFYIPENIYVAAPAITYTIGRIEGYGRLGGWCWFAQGGREGINTWRIGINDETDENVFMGSVAHSDNLNKIGINTLTLAGATHSIGNLTIDNGCVCLPDTVVCNAKSVSLSDDGILAMKVGSNNLTIRCEGELSLSGTLRILLADNYSPRVGDRFRLWQTSTISNSNCKLELPSLPDGLYWDISDLYQSEGILRISDVESDIFAQHLSDENVVATVEARASGGAITITRSLNPNHCNAVVLPCALNDDDLTSLFGSGYVAYAYSSASSDGHVYFAQTSATEAGVPFLVVPTASSIAGVTLRNKAITPDIARLSNGGITFTGTYNLINGNEAVNKYFISDNKLYQGSAKSTINPMRGYFYYEGSQNAKNMELFLDGISTGIGGIEILGTENSNADRYNLSGQKVNKNYKGIVVVNGKKYVQK